MGLIKRRNIKFTVLLIMLMMATMFTGIGPISATDEAGDTGLVIPVITIDSEQFQQLGSVSIPIADVEIIPAEGEVITIQLPAGCEFNGSIGEDAVKSGLIIEYTNILEISSEKIADNEVNLIITGNPGADQEGNNGSILIDFAAIKVTAGAGNIEATLLSSGTAFPEMTTAIIAAISDETSEPPAETGIDPDDTPGDNPGDETPGNGTPGDDTPGDDTPGDDTPDGDTPGDDTPVDDTPGDIAPGDDTEGELLPPNSGDNPEEPEVIVPQNISDPKQIFMSNHALLTEKTAKLSYAQKKLDTRLLQLLDEEFIPPDISKNDLILEMQKEGQLSKEKFITRSEEGILAAQAYVYIDLMPGSDPGILDSYVSELTNSSSEYNLAVAWVEVGQLENLASLAEVQSIRMVEQPVHNTGTITSEGDAVHRADLLRSQTGKDGTGVKIGIISDGVDNWTTARNSGDLPANLHVLSNLIGGDEGTAMLEIVHDLAPGAELYFHDCGNNTLAFNDAISELAAAGCNIICDDIGWITQPFFEDGEIAQHVAYVIDSYNIIYVSSAGNSGASHYQGQFHNDGYNFDQYPLYVNIPAGASVRAVLQWNDSFGYSANDYNFYLWDTDTGDILTSSNTTQNGSQNPLEFIKYTNNTGSTLNAGLSVHNYSATSKILEMYVYGANGAGVYTNNRVAADSIFGHAAVPKVISCGAVRASTPGNIEPFSSQGPVTMLNGTRQKPDIVGADGVAVTGAGGFSNPFYGTSAAAPHIAAVAALGWSQDLAQTADQVRNKIMTGAIDLGSSGYDNVFGYGLADVLNAFRPPAINLKGYARYPNAYGDYSLISVTAKTGTWVININSKPTDSSGLFEFILRDGTYTLELERPGYLDTVLKNILVTSSLNEVSTASAPIELRAGDVDGSGLIDLSDLGLLASAYGANSSQANYLQAADFDCSNLIDLSDLGFLASNYGDSATEDPLPLSIGTANPANAAQNQPYAGHTFTASCGTAPYSFAVISGSLPTGMSLSTNGYLSGIPTASGTFNFTVRVTDSKSATASHAFALTVSPAPLVIGTANPANAAQNQPYAGHTFTAIGGTASYNFSVISGSLPAGMNLSTAGYLSGTPTASGTFDFTVRVTDSKSVAASHTFSLAVSAEQKGWTIMLYSDADNDLEPQLLLDIAEAKAGITNDVNMVALVDRIPGYSSDASVLGADFTDTRLYRITPGTAARIGGAAQFPEITTTSNYEANMGDANTLKKFIQFCKANYPAENYALILSNHGDGARSGSTMIAGTDLSIENGVCSDDTSEDILYIAEITDVLGTAESVDLLAFDACLMGTAEVAYQYRPGNGSFAANVMVASAPNVWGYGLDYQAILARLNTNGGNNGQTDSTMGGSELNYNPAALTALQLGGIMVEEQFDSTAGIMNDQSLACYDLSKVGTVKTAFDTLVRDIYSKSERSDFESIRGSGSSPITMKYFNAADEVEWIVVPYFDFYDLCKRVNSSTTKFDSATRSQAAAVMTAVDNMIVYSFGGTYYPGFTKGQNGLSVFFPDGARLYSEDAMWAYQWWYNSIDINSWWPSHYYGKLKWCKDGQYTSSYSVGNWFEMLDAWYDSWGNDTDGGCNGYRW